MSPISSGHLAAVILFLSTLFTKERNMADYEHSAVSKRRSCGSVIMLLYVKGAFSLLIQANKAV